MIVACSKCGRQRPPTDEDIRISHTYCARCYVLFPEVNGGIDWKSADSGQIKALKDDISGEVDKENDFAGESKVVWPEGGVDFVEKLINEVLAEREVQDGARR